MDRRFAVVVGLVLVGLVAIAAAYAGPARRDDPAPARHRERTHRPLVPRERATPAPTEEPEKDNTQHGSSEGQGVHIEGTKTEHHEISGSGSVSVSSGAVDPGTGGADAHGSYVGPAQRRPPRRR